MADATELTPETLRRIAKAHADAWEASEEVRTQLSCALQVRDTQYVSALAEVAQWKAVLEKEHDDHRDTYEQFYALEAENKKQAERIAELEGLDAIAEANRLYGENKKQAQELAASRAQVERLEEIGKLIFGYRYDEQEIGDAGDRYLEAQRKWAALRGAGEEKG